MIKTAQSLAERLNLVTANSFPVAELAKGLARLHYFRLAREAVETQAPDDKLAVYIVILQEYAVAQNPSLAKSFEEEKRE